MGSEPQASVPAMTVKAEMGGVFLEETAVVGRGISRREPRISLVERSAAGPTELLEEKKNPFPNHKGKLFEAGIPSDCRLSPAFCERPSIFIAINSVKVGFTKENGGNHLVICSSAETSLSISVPGWTRGPGLLCCLCQELNIAICNCVSQRQAS